MHSFKDVKYKSFFQGQLLLEKSSGEKIEHQHFHILAPIYCSKQYINYSRSSSKRPPWKFEKVGFGRGGGGVGEDQNTKNYTKTRVKYQN